jgi:hypothetical protein
MRWLPAPPRRPRAQEGRPAAGIARLAASTAGLRFWHPRRRHDCGRLRPPPRRLRVTLKTAKSLGYENVWAVFQPYTFSRTVLCLKDFAEALAIADRVVLSAIMGGRERNTWGITSAELGQKIPGCVCLETFEEIADYVMQNAGPGDLVITLGCGDVYKCANLMMKTNKKMSKAVTAE